ncbi:hypothetical protein [Vampirovibrio chlorellavorus]|uniref:hypothetical protein n=1 Tax=Vampirovibrio chlorellavorus TaxID=758823 RepID=UPI0026F1838B|nr:hypothetical protein [Vampirovibrio chlorellavorus]
MDNVSWFQIPRPSMLSAAVVQFQGGDKPGPPEASKPKAFLLQSDQLRLSVPQSGRQPHFNPRTTRVLLSVDYDGTLSTDLVGAERFQQQRSDCLLHLNTGRCVEDLAPLGERLRGLKLYALSTSNGEGLFINHQALPANRWIAQIAEQQQRGQNAQSSDWRQSVQSKTGWDHFRVGRVIRSFIERRLAYPGFGPLECVPQSEAVASAILETLRQERIQADFSVEGDTLHKFCPQGYAKHSPVSFLAARCPNLKRVVVAGDGLNDYALMTLESVVNGRGQPVAVDRVLVARDNAFVQRVLQEAPNPLKVRMVSPRRHTLFESIADRVASVPPDEAAEPSSLPQDVAVVTA